MCKRYGRIPFEVITVQDIISGQGYFHTAIVHTGQISCHLIRKLRCKTSARTDTQGMTESPMRAGSRSRHSDQQSLPRRTTPRTTYSSLDPRVTDTNHSHYLILRPPPPRTVRFPTSTPRRPRPPFLSAL